MCFKWFRLAVLYRKFITDLNLIALIKLECWRKYIP
jgi:hypothetical protein